MIMGLVAGLVAPSFGPILDHHFAERQPGHMHFGTPSPSSHLHAYGSTVHGHTTNTAPDNYAIAIYKYDGNVGASTAVTTSNNDWASLTLFEPTSVLVLPSAINGSAHGTSVAPLLKPPQSNL